MHLEDIQKYITTIDWLQSPSITYLASGYGNDNYRINDKGNAYVCRVKKSTEFPHSLFHEYALYTYLEENGFDFCPRAQHINNDGTVLIESFIDGNELSNRDFTDTQIKLFVSQLYTINTMPVQEIQELCTRLNIPQLPVQEPLDSLQVYGFDRFQSIDAAIVDQTIIDWIYDKLLEAQNILKHNVNPSTQQLLWGDVQDSVLHTHTNELYFFDFEHTHIGCGSDLSYLKIHSSFTAQQLSLLIKEYAHLAHQSEESIWNQIEIDEHITRINDVVWAAMKWSETNDESFKTLTYERQKLVPDTLDLPA